jgi:hypothetical protein
MEFQMFLILTGVNTLSLLVFLVVNKETKRVTESHIELIQKVNAALVETRILRMARFAYLIVLMLLIGFSYILFYYWAT